MCNTSDILSLFFSLCLVVAAFLTFLAICVQAFIYNSQLQEMKRSTDAATKAAIAAEQSIALAKASTQLDQRAWVAVTSITTKQPEIGQPYKPVIVVKNSGKTFAKKMRFAGSWRLMPKGTYPDFAEEDRTLREGADGSGFILAPNSEHNLTDVARTPLSEEEGSGYKSGDLQMFVYGKITYADVFGCEHWTTFCAVLTPEGYSAVGEHNDVDDNRSA
jgi:hypothetical protein